MEMRACEETGMSRDLTPPIRPLAASLHDSFLLSHCSSCFLPIPVVHGCRSPEARYPHCCRGAVLGYCSSGCWDADVGSHASSGECQLLRLVRLHFSQLSVWREGDTADLRAAVRLMYSFEKLGLLPALGSELRRIGGLLAGDRGELEEGSEMRERISEGGALMSQARKLLRCDANGGCDSGTGEGGGEVEEAVLWAVVTNAVEVQVGEGRAIGIAIYGPRFSWFNHSCSPNACYRFELLGSECFRSAGSRFLVYPTATGSEDGMVTTWALDEKEQNQGLCTYGPGIVVRSIRPIKQGEEVCITYTDLLQPMALRRSDLWSKYGFLCCCKRCTAIPVTYVDHILSETALSLNTSANLNPSHGHPKKEETQELDDILNQAVTEYLSTGGPEACCSYIENILSKGFHGEWLQLVGSSPTRFKLQPLHHISLKAYIILASMYRIRGFDLQTPSPKRDGVPEVFDMNRAAAAAYSLLLAGTTNHLFLSNTSLIATTAIFWISAGESLLGLVSTSLHGPRAKLVTFSDFTLLFGDAQDVMTHIGESSLPWDEFNTTSLIILGCVSSISSKVWPSVTSGIQCLRDVKNPVDFSWLEKKNVSHQGPVSGSGVAGLCCSMEEESRCMGCKCETEMLTEEDGGNLYRLAVHCLVYGGFLATICYGHQSYWVDHIRELLCTERGR